MKKILFINHSRSFGGAQRSLFEILKLINKKKEFDIKILSPSAKNNLLNNFNIINFNYLPQFYNGYKSYYSGFRWLIILREILYLLFFFIFCINLKIKYKKFDMVYFNDITLLPCLIIKIFFKTKIVSALRSLQKEDNNIRRRLITYLIKKYIYKIVSIDNDIFNSTYSREKTIICRNIFSVNKKKHIKKKKFIVTYVGTLLKEKGIENFEKVAKYLATNYSKLPIYFYIVGEIPKKNLKYYLSVLLKNEYYIPSALSNKNIFFVGKSDRLDEIYQNTSVITFFATVNSIGRPIIEGSYYKLPSIVYLKRKKSEYVINKKTGFIIYEGDTKKAAESIVKLYRNKKLYYKMGINANSHVKNLFDEKNNFKIFNREILQKI